MQTSKLLAALFSKLTGISKSQKKFLSEMILVILALRGRVNFTNMARYSSYHESSMRRGYAKDFNFVSFNQEVINLTTLSELIGMFDCSFISKAGKHTYGKDKSGSDLKVVVHQEGLSAKGKKWLRIIFSKPLRGGKQTSL